MAVYDVRFKRFVLPKNLMRFNVYVNVHEIRKFKTVIKSVGVANPNSGEPKTGEYVNENTSQVRFKFSDCIWDVSASGKVFEGVTNIGGVAATTEMKWSYSLLEMISQYSGFDSALAEDKQQNSSTPGMTDKTKSFSKDKLSNATEGAKSIGAGALANLKAVPGNALDKTKSFGKDKLDSVIGAATSIGQGALDNLKAAPGNIIDAAKQKASGLIDTVVIGNLFGLTNQLLGKIPTPQGLVNAALGAAVQASGLNTSGLDNITFNLGGSIFDPSTNTLGGLNSINAFGPSGPAQDNGGLSSSNIFE
jgi:hypothetical protein